MNLDDELRQMMLARADEAPAGTTLLDDVRVRSRHLDTRRRVAVVAVVALAAAAIAAGAPYALRARGHAPGGPPTPSATGVALGPPRYRLPGFPLTPGWKPPRTDDAWTGLANGRLLLGYLGEDGGALLVQVGRERPSEVLPTTETRATTVGSAPATLRTGAGDGRTIVNLTWQLPDGQWVDVLSTNLLTVAEVERFARELTLVPMDPLQPRIRLGLVPIGYALRVAYHDEVCFEPEKPGVPPLGESPLCVRTSDIDFGGGQPLTGGRYPAEVISTDTYLEVHVAVQADLTVIVTVDLALGLSPADLVRIGEGVTVL